MITAVRIQNLRSLRDTGFVDLKKITVLLGANSSGKSTFLRSFPLFTQSVAKNLREPISWFDDGMVDFGDFETAKCKYANKDEGIVLTYKITPPYDNMHRYFGQRKFSVDTCRLEDEYCLSITYSSKGKEADTYIREIKVESHGQCASFIINGVDDSVDFYVDGRNVHVENMIAHWGVTSNMLPSFYPSKVEDQDMLIDPTLEIRKQAIFLLKKATKNRLKNEARLSPFFRMENLTKEKLLSAMRESHIQSIAKRAELWTAESPEFVDVYDKIVTLQIVKRLPLFDTELRSFYMQCSYIAPTRAEANRYYRNQGLQVNDIDAYGRNLQEFIASLSQADKRSFVDFVKDVLGITVYIKKPVGQHLSIFIKRGEDDFNMTDTGFGYSQILPILTKIWYMSSSMRIRRFGSRLNNNQKVLIEQPELHLHPALQAKLADTFIKAANQDPKKLPLSFVIETHSPTIINRLGKRVREGEFSKEDINIVIFQKDDETHEAKVSKIGFNDNGIIEEWPFGFFDPLDD